MEPHATIIFSKRMCNSTVEVTPTDEKFQVSVAVNRRRRSRV